MRISFDYLTETLKSNSDFQITAAANGGTPLLRPKF